MRRALIFMMIFFGICSIYAQTQAQEPGSNGTAYGLEDLFRLGLENSEKIKISGEDLHVAEAGKDKAAAGLIPRFSAFGSYTRYAESKNSSTGSVIQPVESGSWGLKIDRTLSLSGRDLTALAISKYNIEKNALDLYSVKEDYLLHIASAYYEALKAGKATELARANAERLAKYRNAAQTRLKIGEITKTALLRAQAELSGAQSEIVRTGNNLKLAFAVLARTAGIEENFTLEKISAGGPHTICAEPASMDSLLQTAYEERVEIKAASAQKKMTGDQVKFAKGAYWPSVTLEAVYTQKDEAPASAFLNKESLYGGVRLDFPFYEGGLRKAEVDEAKARDRQTELLLLDLRNNIRIEVKDAFLSLTTQREILKSLEEQLVFAKDNYNAVSKQFEFGLAGSLDVLDANTLLASAERQFADAGFNCLFSAQRLKKATGTLLKSFITEKGQPVSAEKTAADSSLH